MNNNGISDDHAYAVGRQTGININGSHMGAVGAFEHNKNKSNDDSSSSYTDINQFYDTFNNMNNEFKRNFNNKKKKIYIFVFIIAIILILCFYLISNKKINNVINREKIVLNKDYLYEKGVEYIKLKYHDLATRKESSDYQVIVSYKPFGITNDGTYDYAYMWVLSESYFVKKDSLYNGRSNSSLYKIYFKNDKIIKYYMPLDGKEDESAENYVMDKDGIQFKSSDNQESDFNIELKSNCLNKMVYNEIKNYKIDLSNENLVKEHYSYLNNLTIYHEMLGGTTNDNSSVPFPNCQSRGGSGYESCN